MQPGDVVRHKTISGKFLVVKEYHPQPLSGKQWWVRTPNGEEKLFYEIEFVDPEENRKATQKAD
jgi:hypothetical protein